MSIIHTVCCVSNIKSVKSISMSYPGLRLHHTRVRFHLYDASLSHLLLSLLLRTIYKYLTHKLIFKDLLQGIIEDNIVAD